MNTRQSTRLSGRRLAAVAGASALVAGMVVTTAGAAHAAAPGNDDFAHAQVITGTSISRTGSNVGASTEAGENLNTSAGLFLDSTVWYAWTAPVSGYFSVNTDGTSFDTTLSVYTGSSMSSLKRVTANDDTDDTAYGSSSVGIHASAGTKYHIQVGGSTYQGAGTATGTFNLQVGQAAVAGTISFQSAETADPQSACVALLNSLSAQAPMADSCASANAGASGLYAVGPVVPGNYYVVTFTRPADPADGIGVAYPGTATPATVAVEAGCTLTGLNIAFDADGNATMTAPSGKSCPLAPKCTSAKASASHANATLASDRATLAKAQRSVATLAKQVTKAKKHHKRASVKKLTKRLKNARNASAKAAAAVRSATAAVAAATTAVARSC